LTNTGPILKRFAFEEEVKKESPTNCETSGSMETLLFENNVYINVLENLLKKQAQRFLAPLGSLINLSLKCYSKDNEKSLAATIPLG